MPINIDHNRVEFLGIHIIFTGEDDPRGSVWVPFSEELTLLYGKNGAGKSTILRAITAFVSGHSLEDEGILIYGFARLKNGHDTCALMDQSIKDMPNTGFLNDWEDLDEAELIEKFAATVSALDLPYNKWESSLFAAVPESVEDLNMNWEKFVTHFLFLGLWERDIRNDFGTLKSFVHHLIDHRTFCLQPNGKMGNSQWNMNLAARLDDSEVREAYEESLLLEGIVFMAEEPENPVAVILQDLNILAERPNPPRSNSPYIPAARIDPRSVNDIGISALDLNDEFDLHDWTQRRVVEMVYSYSVSLPDPWFAHYKTLVTPTQAFEDSIPDLDEEDFEDGSESDEELWAATFRSRRNPVGTTIEFDFESERHHVLQRALTFIAKELPSEIGITDMRITLSNDLGAWVVGNAGELEVFDIRSRSWIPVLKTSAATQKIIGMALNLHAEIRSTTQTVIVIGDEVDPGLHTLAIQSLYGMLATATQTCFVTSHSPTALASRFGNRLHVHRGILGEILVSQITGSELSNLSAAELGLKANELIGTIDIVIAVEGIHDKLVLEDAVARDERLSHRRLHVTSISGVRNSSNLLDIEFVLSFTDLKILLLTDNVSKTELSGVRAATLERLQAGSRPEKISESLRARSEELRQQRWFEQAQMFDLMAKATERGLLKRLSLSGHTYPDIVMALPPESFGLEESWNELESAHRKWKEDNPGSPTNFKDYLRDNHGVSVNQRTIKKALEQLDETPSGIRTVLTEILSQIEESDWGLV